MLVHHVIGVTGDRLAWESDAQPGNPTWCHSPPSDFRHTLRLTSIPEYILNG
jgi:hypothetical protein